MESNNFKMKNKLPLFFLGLSLLVFFASCRDNIFGPNKATIQGVVTDLAGKPIAGAIINGMRKDTLGNMNLVASGFTDNEGGYQLVNVPLCVVILSVQSVGLQTAYATLNLTQKNDHPLINFVLAGHGTIQGRATDNNGKPIKNASVIATRNDTITNITYSAYTDSSGKYALTNLPVGGYNVTTTFTGLKTNTNTTEINAAHFIQDLNIVFEGAPVIKSFYQRDFIASKLALDSVRFAVTTTDSYTSNPNIVWVTVYATIRNSSGYVVKIYESTSTTPSTSLLFNFALPATDLDLGTYSVEFEAEDNDYNRSTTYPATFNIVD